MDWIIAIAVFGTGFAIVAELNRILDKLSEILYELKQTRTEAKEGSSNVVSAVEVSGRPLRDLDDYN